MKTKQRRLDPAKATSSALGFYRRLHPREERKVCSRCNLHSAAVDHLDGMCVRCWMELRALAREKAA